MSKAKAKESKEKKEEATKATPVAKKAETTDSAATQVPKEEDKYYGTVSWYNPKGKGFGFIVMDGKKEKEDDLFMHRSQVVEDANLNKGDRVSFYVTDPPEGNSKQKPMASEVVLVEKAVEEASTEDPDGTKEGEDEVRKRYENKQKTGDTTG